MIVMDRCVASDHGRTGCLRDNLLPSRRAALESCQSALELGPALLTGAAGAGKTWLAAQLSRPPARFGWVTVDVTPSLTPSAWWNLLGQRLGLEPGQNDPFAIEEELAERSADGRSSCLLVDEAHLATPALFEEIRILSNHQGQPEGFAAIVLAGQTPLVRRLATRRLRSLAARLATRVHLPPIDADEAALLLMWALPAQDWRWREVEERHRDASGNPRSLLLGLSSRPPVAAAVSPTTATPPRPAVPPTEPAPPAFASSLSSPRPPLHVDDEMIEVGWDDETPAGSSTSQSTKAEACVAAEDQVTIDDHYAALQAWNEWARNQGRQPAPRRTEQAENGEAGLPSERGAAFTDHVQVRAEGQHSFAPYSQLFTRARQIKDRG
jgi:general secretion pathway protein A